MKFQKRVVSKGSRVLAILGSIIKVIELDADELDVNRVTLSFHYSTILPLRSLLEEGSLEVFVNGAPWLEERSLELEDIGVLVSVKPSNALKGGLRLRSIYENLPKIVIALDLDLLRRLSHKTTMSGVEFIALYGNGGSLLVLEGDKYSVTIPAVESLARIHTHPEGACRLSRIDVRSAIRALADLSLFEAVVTPTCAFYITRIGFLDESEFEKLLNSEVDIVDSLDMVTVNAEKLELSKLTDLLPALEGRGFQL